MQLEHRLVHLGSLQTCGGRLKLGGLEQPDGTAEEMTDHGDLFPGCGTAD